MKLRSGKSYQPNYVGQKALIDGRWVKHGFGRQVYMHSGSKRLMCYAGGYMNGKPHGYSITYYLDETHGARFDRYICRGGEFFRGERGQLIVSRQRICGEIHFPIADLQREFAKLAVVHDMEQDGLFRVSPATASKILRVWSSKMTCSAVDESAGEERNLFGDWASHHSYPPAGLYSDGWIYDPTPDQKGPSIYEDEDGNRFEREPSFKTFEPEPVYGTFDV